MEEKKDENDKPKGLEALTKEELLDIVSALKEKQAQTEKDARKERERIIREFLMGGGGEGEDNPTSKGSPEGYGGCSAIDLKANKHFEKLKKRIF